MELLETGPESDVGMRATAQIDADPITILRIATGISTSGGSWPHEHVTAAGAKAAARLADEDQAAVRDELGQCLLGRDVDQALQWLFEIGVIDLLLPEVAACVDLAQEGGRRHKDVWEHTKLVVKQAVRRPAVRWAALLHDIGKVPTRRFTDKGVHFHGHAEVGARMFDKLARRFPFERPMRQKLRFLIRHHLRTGQYSEAWTDAAVRRFHREMESHLTDLLDLSRADITSKRPGRRQSLLRQIKRLSDRMDALAEADAIPPALPTGLGTTIMTHFELPPSRLIGDIKKALEKAVEGGELEGQREDAYYIQWVENSGLIPTD
jgi:poly(A) polymerase